jgi:biotin carboxylase
MMTDKGIFILGAGIMQIPAIRIAKEQGWCVAAADGNRNAPGAALCDRFFPVDLKEREALLAAARELQRTGSLDGVFTAGTDFSAAVAWLAERLGLPGIPYEAALNASDKGRMRQRFREADIASPPFLVFEENDTIDDPPFPPPWVVKPVDNMGARGVRKVDSSAALRDAFTEARKNSRSGTVVIEAYIPGPELSLDGLVLDERFFRCGCADRHIVFEPFFVEIGHTMPSALPRSKTEAAWEILARGARALGVTRGAIKGDIKISENGPIVGEIAARLSGGFMSGWTYPYASGREVTLGAMRIAMGMDPGLDTPEKELTSAERAFISIPGLVTRLSGVREAEELPGVKNVFVLRQPGTRAVFPRNNVEKCGNVITQSDSRKEAVSAASDAVWRIVARLAPGDKETEDFLFRNDSGWPPPAYTLRSEGNRAALREMPDFLFPESMVQADEDGGARKSDLPPIALIPLPETEEGAVDWIGRPFAEALRQVSDLSGASLATDPSAIRIGWPFWRGFLAGGIQGGVWVVDTIRALGCSIRSIRNLAAGWRGRSS